MNRFPRSSSCSTSTAPTCSATSSRPSGRTTPRTLTIAHNKAIDHHRGRSRRAVPAGDAEEVAGAVPTSNSKPDEVVTGGDPDLWRAVSALPPKQRSAVVLRYATDMSYSAIARAMDSSEAAARRNVHEGLQKLRGEFA